MSTEKSFQIAFWVLLGLMLLMRVWFAFRVWPAGERLLPDRAAIHREGWQGFAVRCVLFLLLVALVLSLCFHRANLRWFVLPLLGWLRWAGFALGLASLGLRTWTHAALGRFWSAQLQLRAAHRLITSGPYARIRHPMYLCRMCS
jgi:protein-S-isoprenylcysteine O-methyltransferase Ste14